MHQLIIYQWVICCDHTPLYHTIQQSGLYGAVHTLIWMMEPGLIQCVVGLVCLSCRRCTCLNNRPGRCDGGSRTGRTRDQVWRPRWLSFPCTAYCKPEEFWHQALAQPRLNGGATSATLTHHRAGVVCRSRTGRHTAARAVLVFMICLQVFACCGLLRDQSQPWPGHQFMNTQAQQNYTPTAAVTFTSPCN